MPDIKTYKVFIYRTKAFNSVSLQYFSCFITGIAKTENCDDKFLWT